MLYTALNGMLDRRGRVRRESPALRAIKTKYDPENFFKRNVNILPKWGFERALRRLQEYSTVTAD
jgi:hypothetical protein